VVRSGAGRTQCGIAYAVRGSGPPILWISGYVLPASAFDAVASEFDDAWTVVAMDHRGSGLSRAPLWPTTTATMAADAIAVLDHLGIESAHVVGWSLGGMVAQELAIRHPHRVRAVVLGCTTAGGPGAPAPLAPELVSELRRTGSQVHNARVGTLAAFRQGWAASTHDTTGRLGRINAPTLVLHGSTDRLVPVSNATWLAARIPRAELRIIRGAGHLLVLDSPTARRALRQWLDGQAHAAPGSSPGVADRLGDLLSMPSRLGMAQALPFRRMLRTISARSQ
jgi:3-oxoadipate enol-lactonase